MELPFSIFGTSKVIIEAIREHLILAVCWPSLLLSEPVDRSTAHALQQLDVCPRFSTTQANGALGCATLLQTPLSSAGFGACVAFLCAACELHRPVFTPIKTVKLGMLGK